MAKLKKSPSAKQPRQWRKSRALKSAVNREILQPNTRRRGHAIEPAKGKLGVMIPGMGAVATTFVAGVEAVRKGIAHPIGSLTQMGTIRLGKRTDGRSPKIKDFVPLAGLDDLVFTGWDIFEDNMYAAARNAGVLERDLLDKVKGRLSAITPMKAVFDHNYVKKIDGPNVKKGKNKLDLAEQLRQDIRDFKKSSRASRLITIWCASTESFIQAERHPPKREVARKGDERERRKHSALDDLRLRLAHGRRALRQRRAQPDRRHTCDATNSRMNANFPSAARTSRPARL